MKKLFIPLFTLITVGCSQIPNDEVLIARNQLAVTVFDADTGLQEKRVISIEDAQSWVTVDKWQAAMLKNEFWRLTERYQTQGTATPTLVSTWPQLPGGDYEPQEHWFVVLDGQVYWQWRFSCFNNCPANVDAIWIPIHSVKNLFPDSFSFEPGEQIYVQENPPPENNQWERFDGDTLEPIKDDEHDWILFKSPAEVLYKDKQY